MLHSFLFSGSNTKMPPISNLRMCTNIRTISDLTLDVERGAPSGSKQQAAGSSHRAVGSSHQADNKICS